MNKRAQDYIPTKQTRITLSAVLFGNSTHRTVFEIILITDNGQKSENPKTVPPVRKLLGWMFWLPHLPPQNSFAPCLPPTTSLNSVNHRQGPLTGQGTLKINQVWCKCLRSISSFKLPTHFTSEENELWPSTYTKGNYNKIYYQSQQMAKPSGNPGCWTRTSQAEEPFSSISVESRKAMNSVSSISKCWQDCEKHRNRGRVIFSPP